MGGAVLGCEYLQAPLPTRVAPSNEAISIPRYPVIEVTLCPRMAFKIPSLPLARKRWVNADKDVEQDGKYWEKEVDVAVPAAGSDSRKGSEKEVDSFRVYSAGKGEVCIGCIHGAGHSAMSWAILAGRMKKNHLVVSYDLRGHGKTRWL
eukprot:1393820-Amorphochlora_amoeboformis.AAC.2